MLSATIQSKPFDWYRGGHITYDVQKKHDAVVDKAIALFASDMQAVTGEKAKEGGNADVMVYQLNSITNKDLKVLQNLNVPIMEFIAKKDAFGWAYATVRSILSVPMAVEQLMACWSSRAWPVSVHGYGGEMSSQ